MAKWGEGDPRWIVEERPDATNVNNWHWKERDASGWSKTKIKELFEEHKIETDLAEIVIKEVEKCDGEASVNSRKGKLIVFYEWKLVLKWEANLKTSSDIVKGTITIPNLSEENDLKDLDIQISLSDDNNDDNGDVLKQIVFTCGKDPIRKLASKYIESLKSEFTKGMLLPKKDEIQPDTMKNLSSGFNKKINMEPIVSSSNKVNQKVDVTTLKLKEKFQCKAEDFYNALTKLEMVMAFTRGQAKLDPISGGAFEMFGSNISGTFVELVPAQKIVQKWRYKQWPIGHFSLVTISIEEKNDHTEVNIIQTGVPSSDAEVTKNNWDRYYWNSIKQTFGFGAFLP